MSQLLNFMLTWLVGIHLLAIFGFVVGGLLKLILVRHCNEKRKANDQGK